MNLENSWKNCCVINPASTQVTPTSREGLQLELTPIAKTVLEKRYLRREGGKVVETPEEMLWRVSRHLAAVDGAVYGKSKKEVKALEEAFYDLMDSRDYMPNSPTFTGAGTPLGQLSACFVLPVEDSMSEIFDTIKNAALIHQSGGGTGFAFSRLRPQGDIVRSTQGVASGPVSFMKVFNGATEAVKQGGTRRGANMGILRVDHPDIMDFITCKEDLTQVTNFNISVAATHEFMAAVEAGTTYALRNPRSREKVGELDAREIFNKLVECAWRTGEPGLIFIDTINDNNPTFNVEPIESTNPCGEQPLGPYESCNLGSINVANFFKAGVRQRGLTANVDWNRLAERVHMVIHFLDNVIDANKYPLEAIRQKTHANRRIGLGVMGFADLLIRLGIAYDSQEGVDFGAELMQFVWEESVKASEKLAEERGVFPNWKGSRWDAESPLAKAPWTGHRVRNSTVTTVAPTGTISMIAGCSSGIEPLFALAFTRNQAGVIMVDVNSEFERIAKEEGWYSEALMRKIAETGSCRGIEGVPEKWQRVFVVANEIAPEWHVKMQAAFQTSGVDSAVSKTINFAGSATTDDVRTSYLMAYKTGCKGITVYRDGSRDGQVLSVGTTEAPKTDAQAPARAALPAVATVTGPSLTPRPSEASGKMFVIPTHFGKMTLDIHMNESSEPFEVIINVGAAGSDLMADAVGMGMLISTLLRLRSDVPVQERVEIVIDKLKNIGGAGSYGFGPNRVTSLASAVAKGLQRFVAWKEGQGAGAPVIHLPVGGAQPDAHETLVVAAQHHDDNVHVDPCPECGNHALVFGEGCHTCKICGYSKCS